MKKKLVLGFGLIIAVFSIAVVVILSNLNAIIYNEAVMDRELKALARYDDILYSIKSAQSELYRHQAGYSRDIDSLVEYVIHLEDMLALNKVEYGDYINKAVCSDCHSVKGKIATLNGMLQQTYSFLDQYKEKISLIVTIKDRRITYALEKDAARYGDEIVSRIITIKHALWNMHKQMKEVEIDTVSRSKYSIVLAIMLSMFLSLVIVVLVIRSITGPISKLVSGIERVSSGDYHSKVDIASPDEIGFLAKSFNTMTDSLNRMTLQKDLLMQELQELNDSLEKRVSEATEDLRSAHEIVLRNETLSAVGTFASGVAHELATPLSSIISYFQIIKGKGPVPDEIKQDCGLIEGELLRCKNILNSMLSYAKAPEDEKLATDVNHLIGDLLNLVGYQKEYRNINIIKELAPELLRVMAIPGQLKQVFMNIIINALQAMPGGGTLTVRTYMAGDGKKIVVEAMDTGPGITESECNKIFQPFYTTKQSGTGLGLSISYGIIKGHGGDIEVESIPGKGTTFTVALPVAELSPDAASAA